MMSPGIILFLALFHLAIDWIGMLKYYFHPTKVKWVTWHMVQVNFRTYAEHSFSIRFFRTVL